MTHESKQALEKIVELCERSTNLSGRQMRFFDLALEGLGMVSRQRAEIINQWRQPLIQARRDRQMARQQGVRLVA